MSYDAYSLIAILASMEGNINKVIIGAMIFAGMCIPFFFPFLFPKFRNWIKQGFEGDNKKLDLDELKEVLKGATVFFFSIWLGFIVFTMFAFDSHYDWWLITYIFLGILGAETGEIVNLLKNWRK